jgi:hypothetical protein
MIAGKPAVPQRKHIPLSARPGSAPRILIFLSIIAWVSAAAGTSAMLLAAPAILVALYFLILTVALAGIGIICALFELQPPP